jgi:type III secretory pathway component EscV
MTEYQAGTCNINQTERKKRLVIGVVTFINSAILALVLALIPQFTVLYFAIFLLNFTGFLGFLQYREKFCTGLALKKKFKVEEEEEEVTDSEKISEDRRKAAIIFFESGMLATGVTLLVYLVLSNL